MPLPSFYRQCLYVWWFFYIYTYANRITWVFLFSIFFVAWNRRSCLHPRAATTMAAALRASFAALSHSLLFPLCAPDWESFRESCVWLLAVEAAIKAVLFFSSFFLLWSPSPGWQWKICVCWVRFSARSGMRWLMWRMLYNWFTITLVQQGVVRHAGEV